MADLVTAPNAATIRDGRRSTRLSKSLRLCVSGNSTVGNSFSELTLTLAVNCHGCIYASRNNHETGSWVTLGFPTQQSGLKTQPVRAQVKFVRAPLSAQGNYHVGVELETPANIWQIESTPEDWLRFPVLVGGTAGNGSQRHDPHAMSSKTAQISTTTSHPAKLDEVQISPDELLHTLQKNLEQAAEKAVSSAVTSQLKPAVNQAIMAIDRLGQVSIRQAEEHCARYREKLINSAREEVLGRLQADLANAEERLQKQLGLSLAAVQETTQGAAKDATSKAHLILAESVDCLKDTARDFQDQFCGRLREITDRAAAELSAETVRFSDRQFALLAKQAQAAIGDGSKLLEARAADARSQLETAAGTVLSDFQQRATIEIEQAATNARQNFTSSLTALTDATRVDQEDRQRAWQDEIAHSSEQHIEQFRQKLEAILRTTMVTAISSVSDHSSALLNSLAKKAEEQIKELANLSKQD